MNRKIIYALSFIFIIACGDSDKQSKLKELVAQRDQLNAQIEALRSEIDAENGDMATGVVTYVEVEHVQPGLFKHFIKVQGTVTSDNNIMVPSQSSGLVKRIHVTEGQNVRKGDLLAELDGAIYERNLAELNTNLELARTLFERQTRLWDKKIGSEVQFLQAKANKESLENRLASVQEQYRLTKFIAPIDGTVDQINLKEGEMTAAGLGGIRVVQLSKLKIEATLSDKYIDDLHTGDSVSVYLPTVEKAFSSVIRSVSQVIDPKNRTFPIEIEVPDAFKMIKPNMLAVLTINDYSNAEALTAPIRVVQNTSAEKFLFVAIPKGENTFIAEKRIVKTGLQDGNAIEITGGLRTGEYIVTRGFQDLASGQQVSLSQARNEMH